MAGLLIVGFILVLIWCTTGSGAVPLTRLIRVRRGKRSHARSHRRR